MHEGDDPGSLELVKVMEPNYTLSSRISRLQARLWDGLFCWWPLFLGMGGLSSISHHTPGSEDLAIWGMVLSLLVTGGLCLYNLFLFLRTGQTWGKRRMGVLVISTTGQRMTGGGLLWRCVAPMLVAFVPLVGLVSYFDSLFIFSESRRCLHDHLASTLVVDAGSYEDARPDGPGLSPAPSEIGFSHFG